MFFATIINLDLLAFGPTGYGDELFWGLLRTVQISVLAYALGLVLGLCGAMGKLTGGKWLKNMLEGYTTLVRAVPDLVLILLLYYAGTDGINRMLMSIGLRPIEVNGLVAAVFVLGFVYGAYSTEVLRAAIQAVPVGQIEAAKAYGMSPFLRFRRIILPGDAALRDTRHGQSLAQCDQGFGTDLRCGFYRTCTGNEAGRWRQQALSDVLCLCATDLPLHYADFEPGIRLARTTRKAGPTKIGLR